LNTLLLYEVPVFLLKSASFNVFRASLQSLLLSLSPRAFCFSYTRALGYWNLLTCVRKRCLDVLYLVDIYSESELCHSLSEIARLRVPCLNQKHFYLFYIGTFCCLKCKHSFS
jgi:hypothetical protein